MDRRHFLALSAASLLPPSGPSPRRRIACEEHFTLPEITEAVARRAPTGGFGSGFVPNAATQELGRRMSDLGALRLEAMDAAGIDMQLLMLSAPGVQVFDAVEGTAFAVLANDRLAEAVSAHPTRLAGLAAIAPQDPQAAAAELERGVRTLGLKGAIVNSHTDGEFLDDPKFLPILETAQTLDVPIYIHPRDPAPSMAGVAVPGFNAGWAYAVDAGTHALKLIAAGVFDRLPRLKIVIGHMGEGIPFFLDRIDSRYAFETQLFPDRPRPARKPSAYFRENFHITTSGMNYHPQLLDAVTVLGAERVLFAADYPFENLTEIVASLDTAPVSGEDLTRIYETNARRLFRL